MTLQCSACRGAHASVTLVFRCHWIVGEAEMIAAAAWVGALKRDKEAR